MGQAVPSRNSSHLSAWLSPKRSWTLPGEPKPHVCSEPGCRQGIFITLRRQGRTVLHGRGTFFHHNHLQKDTQHMQPREAEGKYIWVGRLGGDEQQRERPIELGSVCQSVHQHRPHPAGICHWLGLGLLNWNLRRCSAELAAQLL